jgi:methyltransferase (TIGR00027 family)
MMQQIRNVTGTAFVVAEFRAEENFESRPLYRDAVVHLFLNEESRQAAAQVATGFPLMKEMVKIRTKYFDDALDRQLASGCRQVVILGSGLDTRAIRKSAPGVTYFEIDDDATLALKRARIASHGIRANVKLIAGNYVRDGLMPLLRPNGFDPEQPTFVLWEGNTMYLPIESGKAIVRELRAYLRDFHLSFDYFATAVITKTTGRSGMTRMIESFADMGAPWVTGFDDVGEFAANLRLGVVDNFTTGELHRAYRPDVSGAAPAFGPFYSVCTLASA